MGNRGRWGMVNDNNQVINLKTGSMRRMGSDMVSYSPISDASIASAMHNFVGRSPFNYGSQAQAQALRPMTPQISGRPTTALTHKTVRHTTPQTQKSTTPARPTMLFSLTRIRFGMRGLSWMMTRLRGWRV
jgi:hypothetical protein